ncbi:MAG: phosphoglucomutase/phosphomannomutase family protein [Planctomycetales bacterium]|nr:phosphoglucomutase/phosphomannomutase family protein [bacterium]UNM08048.1 MAG: phosphoglucomutase/phosphomannomutase family protein [Planctomycetales bacterium]
MSTRAIKFGTDGWRSIIADGFTFDNVALVATAITAYLKEQGLQDRPLLVGYDRRFSAEEYAAHFASTVQGLGQPVMLSEDYCPTPCLAVGVQHHKAAGAAMFTASHNHWRYQGLKFIPDFAGPAMPETTDRITELIGELRPSWKPPAYTGVFKGERIDLKEAYFERLRSIVNANAFASWHGRVLYDSMHGCGAGYLDELLREHGLEVVSIHSERDVYFGGGLPDPSYANLKDRMALLDEHDCRLLIGNDGDADRVGIMDRKGNFFTANDLLPLIADYLVRYKNGQGHFSRTVCTSHQLDQVAKEHGREMVEVKVGFKYVAQELLKGAMIGGEESGGISVAGHVPEKDGTLGALLTIEMLATSGERLVDLLEDFENRHGHRSFNRHDLHMAEPQKQKLFSALEAGKEPRFGGHKVVQRITIDGYKYVLDDGSWVMMRASGTEPVVRIYIETTKPDSFKRWQKQILDEISQISG